ncbi:MAG: RNA ligase family protein [Gammaproteobacteria bacterium]
MHLANTFEIAKSIQNESSKLVKEALLKKHKDNKQFRNLLNFLLNPFVVTGISSKKMNKSFTAEIRSKLMPETTELHSLNEMMEYLMENNTGKDLDVLSVTQYVHETHDAFGDEVADFVVEVATKDFKLGISEKTVNKVYGKNTIPSFGVMLAESFAKKGDKIDGEFFVTLKLDGNRCLVVREGDSVKFFTRKGQQIEGLVELEEQFKEFATDMVYDGELLLEEIEGVESGELFRMTQKIVRKDGEKKGLHFHMFDALPLDEFIEGKSTLPYARRRAFLEIVDVFIESKGFKNVHVLPVLYRGTDKDEISKILESVEEKGYEGLMVNSADGKYVTKRTSDLQKVKTMTTSDLLVLDIEMSDKPAFKGLLGRVNVEYKGNKVGVGSGFTIEQREQFTQNPDDIIGKVIEVQHFGETQDSKTKMFSLRFPIFKGVRDDKTADDVNYE